MSIEEERVIRNAPASTLAIINLLRSSVEQKDKVIQELVEALRPFAKIYDTEKLEVNFNDIHTAYTAFKKYEVK